MYQVAKVLNTSIEYLIDLNDRTEIFIYVDMEKSLTHII